jgi:hypothetical protein
LLALSPRRRLKNYPPEDMKVSIGGSGAEEGKAGRGGGYCLGGEEVAEMGGSVKALNPVAG